MDLGLKGKVVIITGGSEGIGKASAMRFAQEGARIAICARRKDPLDKVAQEIKDQSGSEILSIQADVTNQHEIERVVEETIRSYGALNILVNNAGTSASHHFEDVTEEAWDFDLDLKLRAAIRFSRAAIPHMRQSGEGRIVNVTAIIGKAPQASSMPTSVTRAAGIALTKALSKDLAKYNILVNTVCIGLIKSGQLSWGYDRMKKQDPGLTLPEYYNQLANNRGVPLGRIGEAEEAADVIAFLASERASYLTGTSINIDGGTSAVV